MYQKEITNKQKVLDKRFKAITKQQKQDDSSDDIFSMDEFKGTQALPEDNLSHDEKEIYDLMKMDKTQVHCGKLTGVISR